MHILTCVAKLPSHEVLLADNMSRHVGIVVAHDNIFQQEQAERTQYA